jgi:hypothetical protein
MTNTSPKQMTPAQQRMQHARDAKSAKVDAQQASPKPQMKAKPNWDSADPYAKFRSDVKWRDFSGEDRLAIDSETIQRMNADGFDLEWIAISCMGQSLDYSVSQRTRNGWVPVEPGDIPGITVTEVDGLQLYCRPLAISRKAKEEQARDARHAVTKMQHGLLSGDIPGVTLDSRHSSAVRSNKIVRTYEPLGIPDND